MIKASNVPSELKQLNNWVLHKNKIPFDAKTLKNAKSNDKSTWSDFATAYATLINEPRFDGLGFMLADEIICIDLDNKENEMPDDEFKGMLHEILDVIPSYCEISMSGKGYHIFAKGKLPEGYRKKKHIEMYDSQRFIAFTGNIYGNFKHIIDAQEGINKVHAKYLGNKITIAEPIEIIYTQSDLSVDEVLEKGKNNQRFVQLYEGNWEALGFPSQSEADASFSSMLAFYTNNDINLMEKVFKTSGLYRQKFDRKQSNSTYGRLLLESAVAWATEHMDNDLVHAELVSYKVENYKEPEIRTTVTESGEKVEVKGELVTPSRFTDTANSQYMLDSYGDIVRYNYDNKAWYIWNGKVWEWDLKDRVKQYAEQVGNDMLMFAKRTMDDQGIKNALRVLNSAGKKNMIEELKHQPSIPILNEECDMHQFKINTLSGVYDLEQRKLLQHDKSLYFTKIIPYEISTKPPTRWLNFLHEVFLGDIELIKYVQKLIGYTLTGSIKEQSIFILYGGGNNGKSIFIDTLQAMMGDYASSVPMEVLMEKKGGVNIETTIARIKGARLIHASESESDDQINEGLIKQITGGEKIVGRFLYGNQFEYYPEYKLWISTNNKPIIKGTDFGIWRRIVIIPFKYVIPEDKVDKDLMEKLRNEIPSILNWAIKGFELYEKEGLELPQVIIDEKKTYRSEMDYMANFIEDRIEKKQGYQLQASIVYSEYEKWCKRTNSRVLSAIAFGKEYGKYFDKKRTGTGFMYLDCAIKTVETSYTLKEYGGKNE